jgi:hypothetical protein
MINNEAKFFICLNFIKSHALTLLYSISTTPRYDLFRPRGTDRDANACAVQSCWHDEFWFILTWYIGCKNVHQELKRDTA